MPLDRIIVHGAREHNLKNIDVVIPRDKLVVITGVSGSGKSSLAFDTIYAEGQRRYVESLSAYARQFLGQMEKPDVDYIEGLSPAICIDQKGASRNPRSTVGTITEIYDYLRLLFARVGHPHCPQCGREIAQQTAEQIVDAILEMPEGSRIMIMAPLIRDRKGEHQAIFEDIRKAGFVRARVDGRVYDVSEQIKLDKNRKHTIEVVVDRLIVHHPRPVATDGESTAESDGDTAVDADSTRRRIADSVETALKLGGGVVLVSVIDGEEHLFSEHFACLHCSISVGEIAPRTFSFNSPHGACPACTGLGTRLEVDPDLIIPDKSLTIAQGAIVPWARNTNTSTWYYNIMEAAARLHGFNVQTPISQLTPEQVKLLLYGNRDEVLTVRHENKYGRTREYDTTFEGVVSNLERRYKETDSDYVRAEIEKYMSSRPCPACKGQRLKPEALAVQVAGKRIVDVTAMAVSQAQSWIDELRGTSAPIEGNGHVARRPLLNEREQTIAHQILKEIHARLSFLLDVGLDYLTLDRSAGTLSGGEAHRIRLATQIGSGLMGVLYICDEPSVGLHPIDDQRLIQTLKKLRDIGNTVLIVEHDESMMRAADYLIDMGPGAGEHGGQVVSAGTVEEVANDPVSLTGQYLKGTRQIPMPRQRRPGSGRHLVVVGARENNLKNVEVRIPLGMFVCITGVSGSGKSTLLDDILYRKLAQVLYKAKERPGDCDKVLGVEHIDKVVNVDQSPIGRTPRSNPATYTGVFTPIRELFATMPEARMRGYGPGRFSFNVKGGRCEACKGEGYVEIEMHFLPNITIPCEVCKGERYNREALEIRYKAKSIADVLRMTAEEALTFFENIPSIRSKLQTLNDVGLSYIRLGQPATTLSGGEAQRVKLATELSRRATGRTLYILDEPTTGLSFEDTAALLRVLQRLVDGGNTVIVIEHHLDLIKSADHIIDLGPAGGQRGGYIVAQGTPEEVAENKASVTGLFLRPLVGVMTG
ncbi:MAG: excinuclease ABC subunit UvrA [Chloroflexota bacterium]|nr:MAG: excinuclease ABC subunit UvrA [Chloroflexota bacterium]